MKHTTAAAPSTITHQTVDVFPGVTIVIVAGDEYASPAGKLADAELHFGDPSLVGMRLTGFSIWERRTATSRRNVTFPARTYSVNGERRSFALLRPCDNDAGLAASDRVRDAILSAFEQFEAATQIANGSALASMMEIDQ